MYFTINYAQNNHLFAIIMPILREDTCKGKMTF